MKLATTRKRLRNAVRYTCPACKKEITSRFGRRRSKEKIFIRSHQDETGFMCAGAGSLIEEKTNV